MMSESSLVLKFLQKNKVQTKPPITGFNKQFSGNLKSDLKLKIIVHNLENKQLRNQFSTFQSTVSYFRIANLDLFHKARY